MTSNRQLDLPPRRVLREPSGRDALPWLAIVVVALTVAALMGWWLYREQIRTQKIARARQNLATIGAKIAEHKAKRAAAETRTAAELAVAEERRAASELVVDDPQGKLLWVSPTHGPPISLAYAPNGSLCFVYLKPATLLAHPEGEKALAALGPWGRTAAGALASLSGVTIAELDGVLASLVVRSDGELDWCLRFELREEPPFHLKLRLEADPETGRRLDLPGWPDRARFWVMRDDVGRTRTLVVCPNEFYFALAGSDGVTPLIARDLEALVAQSDADRAATVLVSSKFLAAGGARLVTGEAEPIRTALDHLAGSDATALALSAHWGENFFVELRAAPALSVSPRWLATVLMQRAEAAVPEIESFVTSRSWSEHGRKVVARFPAMLEELVRYTRTGEGHRQGMVRAYLPAAAGHNLLMGAELLLTQSDGDAHQRDAHAVPSTASGQALAKARGAESPATIDRRLKKVTSLVFPRETLQRALELLAEDLGVAIEIDGAALRAEGITQNQSFALAERERPAEEILIAILRLANPDASATGPADPRQKLVYVVDQAAEGGGRMIVTTRAGATESGRALPPVFGGDAE